MVAILNGGPAIAHNFERDHPSEVGFNCSGFREEDLNLKVYDVQQMSSDGKS